MAKPSPGSGFPNISHPKKRAILLAYANTCHLGNACASAKITMRMHHYWLKEAPAYAAAFQEARAQAAQMLEDEAMRRAVVCESDTLLIFLLKGAYPERYREHMKVEHSGTVTLHERILSDVHARKDALRQGSRNGTAP